jgi:hypothetical protein
MDQLTCLTARNSSAHRPPNFPGFSNGGGFVRRLLSCRHSGVRGRACNVRLIEISHTGLRQ